LIFPPALAVCVRQGALHGGAGASAVLAVSLLAHRKPSRIPFLLLAIVAMDLAAGARGILRFGPASMLTEVPPVARAILERRSGLDPPPRFFRSATSHAHLEREHPDRRSRLTMRDNLAVPFGIANVPGYDAARPVALADLLALGRTDVLRLLAVDYALIADGRVAGRSGRRGLVPMLEIAPGLALYQVAPTLPRVYRSNRSLAMSRPAALGRVLDADVLSGDTVVLEPGPGVPILDGEKAPEDGCGLAAYSNVRIEANCIGRHAGLAVFVEQYAAGWTATVNGVPARVFEANTVARAVPVPAGRSHVVLEFRPRGLVAGLWVSAAGLLGIVACFFVGRRGRSSVITAPDRRKRR
jgi:hypothetical protein